ncbi:hypothetical protein HPB50_014394 [Hyalomma asiaticum]|uniref:Uncharacterized protein n=1 Tax=Hyalomma asiaticum TaxID=266040 RepID=A0ACB7THU8_HYAAI|nr:hypothetical protein HPB50_014394 [Hyalomma asiaticum]
MFCDLYCKCHWLIQVNKGQELRKRCGGSSPTGAIRSHREAEKLEASVRPSSRLQTSHYTALAPAGRRHTEAAAVWRRNSGKTLASRTGYMPRSGVAATFSKVPGTARRAPGIVAAVGVNVVIGTARRKRLRCAPSRGRTTLRRVLSPRWDLLRALADFAQPAGSVKRHRRALITGHRPGRICRAVAGLASPIVATDAQQPSQCGRG